LHSNGIRYESSKTYRLELTKRRDSDAAAAAAADGSALKAKFVKATKSTPNPNSLLPNLFI